MTAMSDWIASHLLLSALLGTVTIAIIIVGALCLRALRQRSTSAPKLAPAITAERPEEIPSVIPESRFVDIDGARIHYLQAGTGPDVVLLHGIGASVFTWRLLFPLLQARHRITALDLPGFGQSSKHKGDYGLDSQCDRVCRVLDALGIESAHLVGSSMGGAIALWLARQSPTRFPRIATLAPATDSSIVPRQVIYLAGAAPLFRRALNRRLMKTLLGAVVARRELITPEVVDAYLNPFLDTGEATHTFIAATSVLSDSRLPGALAEVKSEVLIAYGERDRMVTRRSIERLAELLPRVQLLTHPEGGHHIMEDEPAWTARHLEEFFLLGTSAATSVK